MVTSGLRLGSPAGTTRGFRESEFRQIGDWIVEIIDALKANGGEPDAAAEARVKSQVVEMCGEFKIY